MLNDFAAQAALYGLRINLDKTKVLTWDHLGAGANSMPVGGHSVLILSETESEKYLGRKLCLEDSQQMELSNRIRAAWAAFHKHKRELCSKFYRLQDRAKLFEAVVTSVALYGSARWALTAAMCAQLDRARRRMLHFVFRLHRRRHADAEEPWVDYMVRSARRVDYLCGSVRMEEWSKSYRRRKWTWAGALARRQDHRWSRLILDWQPIGLGRKQGWPRTRWADDLEKFVGGLWYDTAQDAATWEAATDGFVSRTLKDECVFVLTCCCCVLGLTAGVVLIGLLQ